jgi:hypothetical protein
MTRARSRPPRHASRDSIASTVILAVADTVELVDVFEARSIVAKGYARDMRAPRSPMGGVS